MVMPIHVPGIDRTVELGAGAIGVVYSGWDELTRSQVAVKVLGPGASVPAFEHERRALGLASSHPNVLTILRSGVSERRCYLVTELAQSSLSSWMDDADPTDAERLTVAVELADGLAAVHDAGFLHLDVKPSNVLVGRSGGALLADFGLARLADDSQQQSAGSLPYAAPETLRGDAPTTASDLWSVGATLYHLYAGRAPFGDLRSASHEELRRQILSAEMPDLPHAIPPEIAAVIGRCLDREPDSRPESAADLASYLRQVQESLGHSVTPTVEVLTDPEVTKVPATARGLRHYLQLLGWGGAILATAAVVLAAVTSRWFAGVDEPQLVGNLRVPAGEQTYFWTEGGSDEVSYQFGGGSEFTGRAFWIEPVFAPGIDRFQRTIALEGGEETEFFEIVRFQRAPIVCGLLTDDEVAAALGVPELVSRLGDFRNQCVYEDPTGTQSIVLETTIFDGESGEAYWRLATSRAVENDQAAVDFGDGRALLERGEAPTFMNAARDGNTVAISVTGGSADLVTLAELMLDRAPEAAEHRDEGLTDRPVLHRPGVCSSLLGSDGRTTVAGVDLVAAEPSDFVFCHLLPADGSFDPWIVLTLAPGPWDNQSLDEFVAADASAADGRSAQSTDGRDTVSIVQPFAAEVYSAEPDLAAKVRISTSLGDPETLALEVIDETFALVDSDSPLPELLGSTSGPVNQFLHFVVPGLGNAEVTFQSLGQESIGPGHTHITSAAPGVSAMRVSRTRFGGETLVEDILIAQTAPMVSYCDAFSPDDDRLSTESFVATPTGIGNFCSYAAGETIVGIEWHEGDGAVSAEVFAWSAGYRPLGTGPVLAAPIAPDQPARAVALREDDRWVFVVAPAGAVADDSEVLDALADVAERAVAIEPVPHDWSRLLDAEQPGTACRGLPLEVVVTVGGTNRQLSATTESAQQLCHYRGDGLWATIEPLDGGGPEGLSTARADATLTGELMSETIVGELPAYALATDSAATLLLATTEATFHVGGVADEGDALALVQQVAQLAIAADVD